MKDPGKSKPEFGERGERDPGESGTNEGQHQTGRLGGSPAADSPDSALRAWLETRVILRPGRPGPPRL
jgi:hypothetical protein